MIINDASMQEAQLSDILQFRKKVYLFFSNVFGGEATLNLLKDAQTLLQIFNEFDEIADPDTNPEICQGIQQLSEFFLEIETRENVIEELAQQYTFLFLGVGGKNTISLCESFYRGEGGALYQDSYFEMHKLYTEAGMGKAESFTEPEDHLSLELAFMAELCSSITGRKDNSNSPLKDLDTQRNFLDKHLGRWFPACAAKLIEIAPSSFYSASALLLQGYLQADSLLIDIHSQYYNQ